MAFSKLTDIYARYSNVTPVATAIPDNYYTLPFDEEYICVSTHGLVDAVRYDFYKEVLNLVSQNSKIQIVQVGDPGDEQLINAVPICSTDIHHTAYVIKNSKLFLSNDNHFSYIASSYNVPCFITFGPTLASCAIRKTQNDVFFEPKRVFTASLSSQENPKTINSLKPEIIANSILSFLGSRRVKSKTLFMGDFYKYKVYDIIPDHVSPLEYTPSTVFNIRNDLYADDNYLAGNLKKFTSNVLTKTRINTEVLTAFKKHIHEVIYIVDSDIDKDFIKDLERLNINYSFLVGNDISVSDFKMEALDYKGILGSRKIESLPFEPVNGKRYSLKSNRVLVSKDGVYLSDYFYKKGETSKTLEGEVSRKDLTNSLLLQDLGYYWISSK